MGIEHILEKEECVNHVAKCMGTTIRQLKTDSSKRGLTLRGRGHGWPTDPVINKPTTYYGKTIRNSTGDAEAMGKAVMATLLHAASTDDKTASIM